MEHKHAALLRMAADNADQLFECDEIGTKYDITFLLEYPEYNWRPVAKPKKTIKRWLWADKDGHITARMYTEHEIENRRLGQPNEHTIKLLWSETEFEEEV